MALSVPGHRKDRFWGERLVKRLGQRLLLSRAKHPSLTGHPRMSLWLSRQLPRYEFYGDDFFDSDQANIALVSRRKLGFARLRSHFAERCIRGNEWTALAKRYISDLQFTAAYRVPFQYSRFVQEHLPLAPFMAAADAAELEDLDGNRFYDLSGSYGLNLFGYDFYRQCLDRATQQARPLGPVLGYPSTVTVENARRLCDIAGLDEVSFHMSGTEAVMQAVRLARYHTGRSHVVRFCGAYHGFWDDVQPGPGNPLPTSHTYTLSEMSETTLRVLSTRDDIACVLVNPIQALHPNRPAPADSTLIDGIRHASLDRQAYTTWLTQLREVCSERGIVLIFDEVMMGFRLALGGAQAYFGASADMVTYGKSVGGGLPVGVICGRGALMRRFRERRPADICFARGTFNAHPYVMASMHEFLSALEEPAFHKLYDDLDATWDARAAALNHLLQAAKLPIRVAHMSTVWTVLYTQPGRYHWLLQFYLRAEGLSLSWVGTGRMIFHLRCSESDFSDISTRFVRAAQQMQADGFLGHPENASQAVLKRQVLGELLRHPFRADVRP